MLPRESSNSRNYVTKNGILSKCDKISKQRKYGKRFYILFLDCTGRSDALTCIDLFYLGM